MTPEALRSLRESRGLTREELAQQLKCSASAIIHWEGGARAIPQWVEEKMLSTTRISFPLDELQELLDLAREEKLSFEELLSEGCKLVLEQRRSKSQAPTVNQGQPTAASAVSPSNITKLPPQHFDRAAEDGSVDDSPPAQKVSYGSGKRKKT